MKLRLLLPICFSLLLSSVGVSFGQQFLNYNSANIGIQIDYPSNWVYTESSVSPYVIFLPSNETKLDRSATDEEGGLILARDTTVVYKNVQLESYLEYAKMQFQKRNVTWDEPSKIILAGYPAYQIRFNNPNGMQGILFAVVKDGDPYVISYLGFSNKFDQYLPVMQKMISTLKFI